MLRYTVTVYIVDFDLYIQGALTYKGYISDSMQEKPSWKADSFSANQKIRLILRQPNVHYRIHNRWSKSYIACLL